MKTTIFTILKSCEKDDIAEIQYNALMSWRHMAFPPNIVVFGDKPGVKELANEVSAKHVPEIQTSESGVELVSDAFNRVQEIISSEIYTYCNGDIVLPPLFNEIVNSVDATRYLLVGQRTNTPQFGRLDFSGDWWSRVQSLAKSTGHLHTQNGMDYFVYPKGYFDYLPLFGVGQWFWDNSMLAIAKSFGIPVLDMTQVILAIHQDHDYSHFPGGLEGIAQSEDSKRNRISDQILTIADADFVVLPG